MVSIGPWGYIEVRSTLYCSTRPSHGETAQLCPQPGAKPAAPPLPPPDPVPPTTPNDKSREFIAIALTENAAKQGRHTTFVACGKNGAKDSLCIIDSDAPEDGYVTKTGSNDKFAQQLYQLGFRHLAISNGRNGFWGADILQDKFTPHQGGAKLQYPDSLNMKPHAVNASWQSASDASTLLDQESKKSRDMGQQILEEQAKQAAKAHEQDLASSLCEQETATSKNALAYDFVSQMLTYTNVDRARRIAGQYWSAEEWRQYRIAQQQKHEYLQMIGTSSDTHKEAFWQQAEDLARNFLGRWHGAFTVYTQNPAKDAEFNALLLREVIASRRDVLAVKVTVMCLHS